MSPSISNDSKSSPRAPHVNSLGLIGEQQAQQYLIKLGYKVLARNWRCSIGELDLVCSQNQEIVFVEVKTRSSSFFAQKYIFETITKKKRRKLKLLIDSYLNKHFRRLKPAGVRLDVIGVIWDQRLNKLEEIIHLKAVELEKD